MRVGVDFGFSSSAIAIVLTEFLKEERKIRVLYAEEFEKAIPQDIVDICFNLYRKHWNTWFFVDGANRAADPALIWVLLHVIYYFNFRKIR